MGLVTYDSSDEDGETQIVEAPKPAKSPVPPASSTKNEPSVSKVGSEVATATEEHAPSDLGPVLGPALGPSRPAETETVGALLEPSPEPLGPPRSPYSTARTLLRDLTLPTVPDLDIPPSPPGTPPPALAALNRKFDNFLELKRTKGVHFNERLAQSAALHNPGLMDKLINFVGIETNFEDGSGGVKQYGNTLPRELWDPAALPAWAFKGPLRKAQEKAHERARGERVEFVAASDAAPRSRSGTPGVPPVTGKRKTRFDT